MVTRASHHWKAVRTSTIRTYSELITIPTLEERYEYLRLQGMVGDPTFGSDRWMNQAFYRSAEWRHVRDFVIARDLGCDLADEMFPVHSRPTIHHMNPMQTMDLIHHNEDILDPEFLITTSLPTHNAIHYGDASLLPREFVPRRAGDTKLW